MYTTPYHNQARGFTLPTVLIVSLALLVIGLSMFQASSSIRRSIDNQYYNRLASEAAQSGVTYGNYCLVENGYEQSWDAANGSPLTQSTDCTGTTLANPVAALLSTDDLQVTFNVSDTTGRSDGATVITATGTVQRLQTGTNNVVATYTKTIKRVTRSDDFEQSQAVYGYFYGSGEGAFFATLQNDGNFRAAGSNTYGQLGNGTTSNTLIPTVFQLPAGKKAKQAFTNPLSHGYQLFVITTDGELYAAGMNNYGQLGIGSVSTSVSTPTKVNLPNGEKATYVGVGGEASFVLTDANKLYAMGTCESGMLGIGTGSGKCGGMTSSYYRSTPTLVSLPTPVTTNLNTLPEKEMVIDSTTAYIRMQGGAVYGWGNNDHGQLTDNTTTDRSSPVKIRSGSGSVYFGDTGQPKAIQLAFDGDTFYAVGNNGKAYAVGRNDFGQVGIGTTSSPQKTTKQVSIPSSAGNVTRITTDQWFASFLTDKGLVYSVGNNSSGQLGNGSTAYTVSTPVQFKLPTGITAKYMYTTARSPGSGFSSTHVIGNNGRVYGAGDNNWGQLGDGTTTNRSTPVAMNVIDGTSIKASNLLSGDGSTIVITTTGVVYSVGRNTWGQLGDGTTTTRLNPIRPQYLQPRAPNYVF